MSGDKVFAVWIFLGVASHIYWWDRLSNHFDGPAIILCLLTVIPAAPFGPLIFFFEGWLYWLTGPHT